MDIARGCQTVTATSIPRRDREEHRQLKKPALTTTESLRDQVYARLRNGLRHGGIGGQLTATERDLADELGVSRTPVREALALLVHDGLIIPSTKGFTLPHLTDSDVADISELRLLVEPFGLLSALDHISRADLKQLQKVLDDQIAAHAANDAIAFSDANAEFRAVWTSRIANSRVRDVIERYDGHIITVREITLSNPASREIVIAGLGKILGAIEKGSPAEVDAAIRQHLIAAAQVLTQALGKAK